MKVARKERRAKVQDFRSLINSLKSFSKNLKKVLTNERSCSIIAKHLRETSGSESLESGKIGP